MGEETGKWEGAYSRPSTRRGRLAMAILLGWMVGIVVICLILVTYKYAT